MHYYILDVFILQYFNPTCFEPDWDHLHGFTHKIKKLHSQKQKYLYFSNNRKYISFLLLSFLLAEYISVVYIPSVNSTYLNFYALAEKTEDNNDESCLRKNAERLVAVCDTNRCSFSFQTHALSSTSSLSPFSLPSLLLFAVVVVVVFSQCTRTVEAWYMSFSYQQQFTTFSTWRFTQNWKLLKHNLNYTIADESCLTLRNNLKSPIQATNAKPIASFAPSLLTYNSPLKLLTRIYMIQGTPHGHLSHSYYCTSPHLKHRHSSSWGAFHCVAIIFCNNRVRRRRHQLSQ